MSPLLLLKDVITAPGEISSSLPMPRAFFHVCGSSVPPNLSALGPSASLLYTPSKGETLVENKGQSSGPADDPSKLVTEPVSVHSAPPVLGHTRKYVLGLILF